MGFRAGYTGLSGVKLYTDLINVHRAYTGEYRV